MLFAQIITYMSQSKPGNGKANSFQPSGSTQKHLSLTVIKKILHNNLRGFISASLNKYFMPNKCRRNWQFPPSFWGKLEGHPAKPSSLMISQFRQDAAHIDLFLHTHVTPHQSTSARPWGHCTNHLLKSSRKSVSVLLGNCNMGARVPNMPPRCHKLWHEPGKKDVNIVKHQPVSETSEHSHLHSTEQTTPSTQSTNI